jgi:hypothetical protein
MFRQLREKARLLGKFGDGDLRGAIAAPVELRERRGPRDLRARVLFPYGNGARLQPAAFRRAF